MVKLYTSILLLSMIQFSYAYCATSEAGDGTAGATHRSAAGNGIKFDENRKFSDCAHSIPERTDLCSGLSFQKGEYLEISRFDVDRDGNRDLVVRRRSLFSCGSHGCATNVYLRRSGKLLEASPPISAIGPVLPCKQGGKAGLRMSTPQGLGKCFIFQPVR